MVLDGPLDGLPIKKASALTQRLSKSMQRFKNILAIYDHKIGDEGALQRAVSLAKMNGARLTVCQAIENLPNGPVSMFRPLLADESDRQKQFLAERKAHLERLVASIRHDGVSVEVSVLTGKPFLQVIRTVLRNQHDLVVMTADVFRGLRDMAFGSTSMHLMRKCPCPVWVMQPESRERLERIVAAVDPEESLDKPDSLNLKIMQLASSLARMEQCELDIVHVWDFLGADLDSSRGELAERTMDQLIEKNRCAHQVKVKNLLANVDLSDVQFTVNLPKGDPAHAIPEFVNDHKVDHLVMGTVARTGIAGFFIGDTAEAVLRQVDCSVLAVKPEGFVTPVTLQD